MFKSCRRPQAEGNADQLGKNRTGRLKLLPQVWLIQSWFTSRLNWHIGQGVTTSEAPALSAASIMLCT